MIAVITCTAITKDDGTIEYVAERKCQRYHAKDLGEASYACVKGMRERGFDVTEFEIRTQIQFKEI